MVVALVLLGSEVSAVGCVMGPAPGSWLAKLELWGKASLGFVRKSGTTWDGGL